MTYDPTVPGPTQRISDTQLPIQTNFDQANTIFNEDHYNFDDASGAPPPPGLRGYHRKSSYPNQVGDPTALSGVGSLYGKSNGGRTDLYYRYDSGSLGNSKVLPISAVKLMVGFTVNGADGVLPGGEINSSYNILTITRSTVGATKIFLIQFADALDSNPADTDLDYIVLLTGGLGINSNLNALTYETPTKNDRITISAPDTYSQASLIIMTL